MRFSFDGVVALLGCLLIAVLPVPRRAEGFRIGFFGAALGFVAYDAMKTRKTDAVLAAIPAPSAQPGLMAIPIRPLQPAPVDLEPVADEDRLSAMELLTGFSILRHLRRTGAVSEREYDQKKADILHRV